MRPPPRDPRWLPDEDAPAPPSPERARGARRTIDALTASPDVFEAFFEAVPIGLAVADLSTHFVRVNRPYAAMLGVDPEDLIGVPFGQVLGGDEQVADLVAGRIARADNEQQYVRRDGHATWLLHGVTSVVDEAGRPAWFAVSAQDVTERRRVEQELRELTGVLTERAVRDPLTGLANRTLLEERLRTSLARDVRSGECTGLLFLDLDGFKDINDRHGHAIGDVVLRVVGERLTRAVRPSDTVARLGGDEFVVLVEGASSTTLAALVPRLRSAVVAPLSVQDLDLSVGVSIGVALSCEGATDPQRLLAQADAQMYAAKRASRMSR
jgi:diguanylate cyclase (GGDEF)-like protein/PAS domain S-box-containing protein